MMKYLVRWRKLYVQYTLLVGLCLLLAASPAAAQVAEEFEEDDEDIEYVIDEEEPIIVNIEDTITALRRAKEYAYMKGLDSTLRTMKVEEDVQEEESPKENTDLNLIGDVLRIIMWAVALLGVGYLIMQLLGGRFQLFVRNKKLKEAAPAVVQAPDVTYSSIQLAQQAAQAGNYRNAVRYYHQYLLQQMAARKMIVVLPQKTNAQYLQEIQDAEARQQFARLSLQYEYVWYGQVPISSEQYSWVEDGFKNYLKKWC